MQVSGTSFRYKIFEHMSPI